MRHHKLYFPLSLCAMLFLLTSLNLFAQNATIGNVNSFEGLGQGTPGFVQTSLQPDANGAVGDAQYVQWVNNSYAVFSKAGALIQGPTPGNTPFAGLPPGSSCLVNNDGQPIVQFDKQAHRWVMSQVSTTNGAVTGFIECVAVSTTNDATGPYNAYEFNYGPVQVNDSPKLGIWTDAYYVSYNMLTAGTLAPAGAALCALDKNAMLAGTPATQICFALPAFQDILPADLDGATLPPAGSPEYFMNAGINALNLWTISSVNFVAGTATLSAPVSIPVAAFAPVCDATGCAAQLGTVTTLDVRSSPLMYRLAYRNNGGTESLVASHTVFSGSTSGVRWYEIRSPGNPAPVVFQQATFAPDNTYRFLSSAAMDLAGNIALGYSLSNSAINPGIAVVGRALADPPSTMGTEIIVQNGTGSQTTAGANWGRYNSMTVDPADDCTLWYTNQYLAATGSLWNTRIANLKFTNCGPDFSLTAAPASIAVPAVGGTANYTIGLTNTNGYAGTVNLNPTVAGLPAGATATFAPTSITGAATSNLAVTTIATTPAGTYTLTLSGTDGTLVRTATVTLVVNAAADFSLSATPASITAAPAPGPSAVYSVSVTALNGYTGTVGFGVSGLPAGATFTLPNATAPSSSNLSITLAAGTAAGPYTLTITGTDTVDATLTHSATVTLVVSDFSVSATPASLTVAQGNSGSYTVSVAAISGYTGTVNLTLSGQPVGATPTFTPVSIIGSGSSTLAISVAGTVPAGSYPLIITASDGTTTHSVSVTLVVVALDFTLSATPASQTVTAGTTASYVIAVGSLNGFTDTVSLSATVTPSVSGGPIASISPASLAGSGTASLTVTSAAFTTPAGTYTITITGTSPTLTHTTTVTLTLNAAADFTISASPSSQTVAAGTNAGYAVTVGSLNTFNGQVNLTTTIAPAGAGSPVVTINPSTLVGSGTASLTVTTSAFTTTPGIYTITVIGTSPGISHSATATIVVNPPPGDFSISLSPSTLGVKRGKSATTTVTITALAGFTGNVQFGISGLPTGVTAKFAPTSVTGSGNSVLTITVGNSVKQGTYGLTVSGGSGTLSHTTGLSIVVN